MQKITLLGLAAAIAILFASCSRPTGPAKKVCYPVKGQVFAGSQPAAGAMVIFHPDGSTPDDWPDGFPRAQVRADGSFEVGTYADNDGAPAGQYTVLITWTQGANSEDSEDTQMIDRLKGRYSDPTKSQLKATVNSGPTELPPIRLP
jgi:hypothetical protein